MPLASAREEEEVIMNANPAANIVLVHGGFVDGSGWRPLYDLLTQDGYHVAQVRGWPAEYVAAPPASSVQSSDAEVAAVEAHLAAEEAESSNRR
jgi:hypothetical protein